MVCELLVLVLLPLTEDCNADTLESYGLWPAPYELHDENAAYISNRLYSEPYRAFISTEVREREERTTDTTEQDGTPVLTGIAGRIARCESGVQNVHNPISTASGYFQFVNGTWSWVTGLPAPASDYPLDVQLEAFYKLWDDGKGASHWAPSRKCWAQGSQ